MTDDTGGTRISYFGGDFVPHEQARVPITSHVVNYGTGCFEGIRAYWNADDEQLYVTALGEHIDRLIRSTLILNLDSGGNRVELCEMVLELLLNKGFRCGWYVQSMIYKSEET